MEVPKGLFPFCKLVLPWKEVQTLYLWVEGRRVLFLFPCLAFHLSSRANMFCHQSLWHQKAIYTFWFIYRFTHLALVFCDVMSAATNQPDTLDTWKEVLKLSISLPFKSVQHFLNIYFVATFVLRINYFSSPASIFYHPVEVYILQIFRVWTPLKK